MPLYRAHERGRYYVEYEFEADDDEDAERKMEEQLWDPKDVEFHFLEDELEEVDFPAGDRYNEPTFGSYSAGRGRLALNQD